MNYGIVIIALGYPLYGSAAFNLALSLKDKNPDVPIAIVYEPSAISQLSERELAYFDHFIEIPESFYTVNGSKQYQRAKLCVNIITNKLGWTHTMYMDADNLWNEKPLDWLFGQLHKRDFYIGMNGHYNVITKQYTGNGYTYWANPDVKTVCKYHDIKKILPQTISGFVFFKNGEFADEVFTKALEVYDDPKAPTIVWAGGKPDEYCMNVALGQLDYTQEPAHIFYFDKINGSRKEDSITSTFWGFATGGNQVNPRIIHLFNRKVNALCIKHKIPTRHYHIDKKDVILERSKF